MLVVLFVLFSIAAAITGYLICGKLGAIFALLILLLIGIVSIAEGWVDFLID